MEGGWERSVEEKEDEEEGRDGGREGEEASAAPHSPMCVLRWYLSDCL